MGHVPHLYVPGPWESAELSLGEAHQHHLSRVLQMQAGSAVTYTDGVGRVGNGVVEGGTIIRGSESEEAAPTASVSVAVASPRKPSRARFLVEKLAELGIDRLIWLETRFGEGRPPRASKAAAWAGSALEQSRGPG